MLLIIKLKCSNLFFISSKKKKNCKQTIYTTYKLAISIFEEKNYEFMKKFDFFLYFFTKRCFHHSFKNLSRPNDRSFGLKRLKLSRPNAVWVRLAALLPLQKVRV
jgi:hypothetical protein